MNRYCIYSRKSKATEKGESIENQIQACKDYIQRVDSRINVDEDIDVYIDDGFSGKNVNRPEFQRMFEKIRRKEYAGLVCYRLDRISRNVCDFVLVVEELNKHGTAFMSVNEGFDTSTPIGRTMMYIASIFAQMERETIAERVKDNMHALAFTGRWLGGPTPYGFVSQRVAYQAHNGSTKYQSILVPNEDEVRVVEMIFSKYAETCSLTGVQSFLKQAGIRNRRSRLFADYSIKGILTNPVYCCADKAAYDFFASKGCAMPDDAEKLFDGAHGIMAFNRHDIANGNGALRPISEWIIAIGDHDGIISGAQFVAVQNKVEERRLRYEQAFAYPENDYALLSGKIYCKKCGSHMYTQRGRKSSPNGYFAYICDGRKTFGADVCDCKYLNGRAADEIVWNRILEVDVNGSYIHDLLADMSNTAKAKRKAQSAMEMLQEQLKQKQSAIRTLVMRMTQADFDETVQKYINEQIQALDKEASELKQAIAHESQIDQRTQADADMVSHLADVMRTAKNAETLAAKRSIINQVIDRVEWDGEQVDIFLLGQRGL